MQIKVQLGKLQLCAPLVHIVEEQKRTNRIRMLQISIDHVFGVGQLPLLHRDPFDRLLIAQTIAEEASLVSNDPLISQYPVNVLW